MNNSTALKKRAKSPLIFLLLMGLLVVATLVVASDFFLRPQMKIVLQEKVAMNTSKAYLLKTLKKNMAINKSGRLVDQQDISDH